MDEKYIHGYSQIEQERLVSQGQVLSPFIFDKVDLNPITSLLEVGSGVGAMTLEIVKRYPDLPITCLEISEMQIAKAAKNLQKAGLDSKINLVQTDARNTGFESNSTFDGAFLCWILEHVPSPEKVLVELHRILKDDSKVFLTEVFHSSLHFFPHCPNAGLYWQKCIDFQTTINGDANMGHRLGNMLHDAGFRNIEVKPYPMFFDKRSPKNRKNLLNYWHDLMFSALENMVTANYCERSLWEAAEQEIFALMKDENTVFYYSFIQATAVK
jgi:ubiquinone/menaquinone biosynthesis C-methylase UbiE